MYGLYHNCARTLKRSLAGKLAIVQLSSGFGFAHNSSRAPCALASFLRACMPRSACTRDVTCELYCIWLTIESLLLAIKKMCCSHLKCRQIEKKSVSWDQFFSINLPPQPILDLSQFFSSCLFQEGLHFFSAKLSLLFVIQYFCWVEIILANCLYGD